MAIVKELISGLSGDVNYSVYWDTDEGLWLFDDYNFPDQTEIKFQQVDGSILKFDFESFILTIDDVEIANYSSINPTLATIQYQDGFVTLYVNSFNSFLNMPSLGIKFEDEDRIGVINKINGVFIGAGKSMYNYFTPYVQTKHKPYLSYSKMSQGQQKKWFEFVGPNGEKVEIYANCYIWNGSVKLDYYLDGVYQKTLQTSVGFSPEFGEFRYTFNKDLTAVYFLGSYNTEPYADMLVPVSLPAPPVPPVPPTPDGYDNLKLAILYDSYEVI